MPKKSTKGARGNGSIRQRPDGRWEARFTVGRDPGTGKQIQRSVYGATQKEVAQKLRQATSELDEGTYHEPCRMTLGEWLDVWIAEYMNGIKELTTVAYKSQIDNHIRPGIGKIRLAALTAVDIQHFYNSLSEGKKPLSAKTIKNIHGVLHHALSQAVILGYIRYNPSDHVSLPKVIKPEIKPLTDDSLEQFVQAIKGHPLKRLFLIDLFTGMREGELLGLSWDCVDFDNSLILINKQLMHIQVEGVGRVYKLAPTKNSKGRVIAAADSVMRMLLECRQQQEEMMKRAGSDWNNPDNLVFTNEIGGHMTHTTVYNQFKRVMKDIGRPEVRFHDLRHSYAVAALQSGDDIKTVQETLGHYTASFTLDVYGHVSGKMKRASAARMEEFIQSVSNSSQSVENDDTP